jgi:FkbM family methyltransferase
MLYNVNDLYVGRSLEMYGEFSEGEVEVFRQMVRPGDVAIDVGANIGAHTVALARIVGPQGGVFAFEPQRLTFQALCANIALNSFVHVRCFLQALSDVEGSLLVPVLNPRMENNFGGVNVSRFTQGERVPVVRLDSLEINRCRFIKIDVEGMELPVLKGATRLIERFHPALYVENNLGPDGDDLIRFIDSLGYDLYWHRPRLFNPNNFFQNPTNVFGDVASHNMLCVPKGASLIEGVPKIEVPTARSLESAS